MLKVGSFLGRDFLTSVIRIREPELRALVLVIDCVQLFRVEVAVFVRDQISAALNIAKEPELQIER